MRAGNVSTPITNNTGIGGSGVHGSLGTLTLNSDGSYNYVADANVSGTDVFSYTLKDGDGDTSVTISPSPSSTVRQPWLPNP